MTVGDTWASRSRCHVPLSAKGRRHDLFIPRTGPRNDESEADAIKFRRYGVWSQAEAGQRFWSACTKRHRAASRPTFRVLLAVNDRAGVDGRRRLVALYRAALITQYCRPLWFTTQGDLRDHQRPVAAWSKYLATWPGRPWLASRLSAGSVDTQHRRTGPFCT